MSSVSISSQEESSNSFVKPVVPNISVPIEESLDDRHNASYDIEVRVVQELIERADYWQTIAQLRDELLELSNIANAYGVAGKDFIQQGAALAFALSSVGMRLGKGIVLHFPSVIDLNSIDCPLTRTGRLLRELNTALGGLVRDCCSISYHSS
jgi:hypothetical protein